MVDPAPLILVVDDGEENRLLFAEMLQGAGFRTETTDSADDALRIVRDRRPNLIVMDISMPVMDGLEATRRLKADETTASIPVIVITGEGPGRAAAARAAGCDGFLSKPCTIDQLVQAVQAALET